jgi:hypothetical protein
MFFFLIVESRLFFFKKGHESRRETIWEEERGYKTGKWKPHDGSTTLLFFNSALNTRVSAGS